MELKGIEFLKPYSINGGENHYLDCIVISLHAFLINYLFIYAWKKNVVSDFIPQIHTKNSVLECSF